MGRGGFLVFLVKHSGSFGLGGKKGAGGNAGGLDGLGRLLGIASNSKKRTGIRTTRNEYSWCQTTRNTHNLSEAVAQLLCKIHRRRKIRLFIVRISIPQLLAFRRLMVYLVLRRPLRTRVYGT